MIAEKQRRKLTKDYEDNFKNPYVTDELGYVDEVNEPSMTLEKEFVNLRKY